MMFLTTRNLTYLKSIRASFSLNIFLSSSLHCPIPAKSTIVLPITLTISLVSLFPELTLHAVTCPLDLSSLLDQMSIFFPIPAAEI